MVAEERRRNPVWLSLFAILIALAALWAGTRARGTLQGGRAPTLDRVLDKRSVTVGVVPYPPLVVAKSTTDVSGYAVDLMNEIGRRGNFTVKYEVVDWLTMNDALSGRRVDAVVTGIFRTPERAKSFTFTAPFMYFGMSAVTKDASIKAHSDLKRPGLRVAFLAAEAGEEYFKKQLPKAEPIRIVGSDLTAPMVEVKTGRADVALGDLATCRRFVAANPEVQDAFARNPLDMSAAGFMLRRDDPAWVDFLNVSIESLILSGFVDDLERLYNSEGIWIPAPKPWR